MTNTEVNDVEVALDTEEIALLDSGIITPDEFVQLSEVDQDFLKFVHKVGLEIRPGCSRPPLVKPREKRLQFTE